MNANVKIERLKNAGLISDEQEKQMTPDQQKVLESLTDEEVRVLSGIKARFSSGSPVPMTDGNIIF